MFEMMNRRASLSWEGRLFLLEIRTGIRMLCFANVTVHSNLTPVKRVNSDIHQTFCSPQVLSVVLRVNRILKCMPNLNQIFLATNLAVGK